MIPVIDPLAMFDAAKTTVDASRQARRAQKAADNAFLRESIAPLRHAFEQLLASREVYVKSAYNQGVRLSMSPAGRWHPYSSELAGYNFHLDRGSSPQWDHVLGFEVEVHRDEADNQVAIFHRLGYKQVGYATQVTRIEQFTSWVSAFQRGIKLIAELTVDTCTPESFASRDLYDSQNIPEAK